MPICTPIRNLSGCSNFLQLGFGKTMERKVIQKLTVEAPSRGLLTSCTALKGGAGRCSVTVPMAHGKVHEPMPIRQVRRNHSKIEERSSLQASGHRVGDVIISFADLANAFRRAGMVMTSFQSSRKIRGLFCSIALIFYRRTETQPSEDDSKFSADVSQTKS